MILIELTAAVDSAGTLQTFYVSTDRFVTSPTDTPPDQDFNPCVIDPGYLGLHCFADGRTGGASKLETGEIVIANADGFFDSWVNYSFDGRPIVIRQGNAGGSYPAGFSEIVTGTVESVEADWRKIIVRIKDKGFFLQKPALTLAYAGNNSMPNGLEGTPDDLKGKLKPRTYGSVKNVSPPIVNTSKLTYQINTGVVNDIPAVYDQGLLITKGADYANSTLLQAAVPGAGTYVTCFAEGYFRLGSSPAGQITADVVQGANAAARTVGQILNQLASDAGLSGGEISGSDIADLDTANSSVVGLWLNDEQTTFEEAMQTIAQSIGSWFGFDPTGVLRFGQLSAPTGSVVASLYDYDVLEGIERRVLSDNGVPSYRVLLNHSKIFTVQDSDLAGAVTPATRAYLEQEYRTSKSEDAAVLTQWLLSQPSEFNTLLTTEADAITEAARRLAIYKVRRDVFEIPVNISFFIENSLRLMDEIGLILPRFGMDNGRSFLLTGYRIELARGTVVLTLWGSQALNTFLQLEDGFNLLLESGFKIVLEQ